MTAERGVSILGSTGSIGTQALEIIHASPELELHSLLCNRNLDLLLKQKEQYAPFVTAIAQPRGECPDGVITGQEILQKAIDGADTVLNAITKVIHLTTASTFHDTYHAIAYVINVNIVSCLPTATEHRDRFTSGGELAEYVYWAVVSSFSVYAAESDYFGV